MSQQRGGFPYTVLKEFEDNVYSSRVFNRTTKQYENCTPLLSRGRATFQCLFEFFKLYDELFDGMKADPDGSYRKHNYLTLMRVGLGTDIWIPPVLDYYRRFGEKRFVDFLKALDRKVSADWITSQSPTKRIENLNAVLRDIEKAASPDEALSAESLAIDVDEFMRAIQYDIYGRRWARYIVLKLDFLYHGFTSPFTLPETISIEHILPQTPYFQSQWCHDFTYEQRRDWTDRIGNLALISRKKNTSQGNRDYADKVERYFRSNIENFSSSLHIFNTYKQWTMTELQQNQSETLTLLEHEYRA